MWDLLFFKRKNKNMWIYFSPIYEFLFFLSSELYEIFLSRAKERWKSFSETSSENDTEGMIIIIFSMKGKFFEALGPWVQVEDHPVALGGSGGALFNLLGVQVVGVVALLVSLDSAEGSGGCNICSGSSCYSCMFGQAGGRRAWWCHPADKAPSAGWTVSEYCSLRECCHPLSVCPQKSDTADQAGCPPCLGFLLWHSHWYHWAQPQGRWSCQSGSSQRSSLIC